MDTSDIVDHEVIRRVRGITSDRARLVVIVAFLAGLAGGGLVAALVYWLYGSLAKSFVILGVFVLLGTWQAIRWGRHYHSILSQLNALEQRVANGEVIYGAQVKFHSYR